MPVAIAGALGTPALALAQTSTVQVFGTMYVEYTVRADQGNTLYGAVYGLQASQSADVGKVKVYYRDNWLQREDESVNVGAKGKTDVNPKIPAGALAPAAKK